MNIDIWYEPGWSSQLPQVVVWVRMTYLLCPNMYHISFFLEVLAYNVFWYIYINLSHFLENILVTNLIRQTTVNTGTLEWYMLTLDEGKPTLEYYFYQHRSLYWWHAKANWLVDLKMVESKVYNVLGRCNWRLRQTISGAAALWFLRWRQFWYNGRNSSR